MMPHRYAAALKTLPPDLGNVFCVLVTIIKHTWGTNAVLWPLLHMTWGNTSWGLDPFESHPSIPDVSSIHNQQQCYILCLLDHFTVWHHTWQKNWVNTAYTIAWLGVILDPVPSTLKIEAKYTSTSVSTYNIKIHQTLEDSSLKNSLCENMYTCFKRIFYILWMCEGQWRTGGGGWVQTLPKFRRPSKIMPNSTWLWKLLKIAEYRMPTPQDVWKKGSKILKPPRLVIVLHQQWQINLFSS